MVYVSNAEQHTQNTKYKNKRGNSDDGVPRATYGTTTLTQPGVWKGAHTQADILHAAINPLGINIVGRLGTNVHSPTKAKQNTHGLWIANTHACKIF